MKEHGTIGFEIRTLNNMLMRRLWAYETKNGVDELTVMHGWIIGFLYENQERDIFQKDIEAEYCIARSSVTGILKLMEKKGYIRRESVAQDARLKKLVLTEAGKRIHESTKKDIDFLEKCLTEDICREELDEFFHVIHQLKRNIENQKL